MEIESKSGTGTGAVQALHIRQGGFRRVEDALAEEGALQIVLDGEPFSMTMRTPGHDGELALGLLHAEGLLSSPADVERVDEIPAARPGGPDVVEIELQSAARRGSHGGPHRSNKPSERRLIANASCGVCGKVSAEDLDVACLDSGAAAAESLDPAIIPALEGRMRAAQALFESTGGSHAAALFDSRGNLLVLREDVGRHNAVDKAVGHLLRKGALPMARILFISGRVSYEIVSKAARAGIPFLLAVSAPSTLAVKLCAEAGITLLAFCRGGNATVYSHPERVIGADREAA